MPPPPGCVALGPWMTDSLDTFDAWDGKNSAVYVVFRVREGTTHGQKYVEMRDTDSRSFKQVEIARAHAHVRLGTAQERDLRRSRGNLKKLKKRQGPGTSHGRCSPCERALASYTEPWPSSEQKPADSRKALMT